ncbi:MAG: substrate-binding domain-containing protein [Eubacterium sp.]|nr:substrate-binding domain-containing protein [Eubacterium sp.]
MDKKKKDKGYRGILIATVVLGVLLLLIVAFSIFFFYKRIAGTKGLMSDEAHEYDSYYVLITDSPNTDFWQSVYQGAVAEAEKHNAYVELLGENLEQSYSKADLLNIAINSNVDGIIIEGDDDNDTVKLLLKAKEEGIPVVTVSDDNMECKRVSYIGVSSYNLGKEYGEQLVKYVKENVPDTCRTMVLMDDTFTSNSQSIILTAINEVIEDENLADKITLSSHVVSSNKDYAAEEDIRDIFVGENSHSGPDVVICLSEKNTLCVYQTVVDYNKVGNVEIFGYYLSPVIKDAIDKEIIRSSIVVDTDQMGRRSIEAMNEYKESGYVSEIYLIDTDLVSKDNLDTSDIEGGDSDD